MYLHGLTYHLNISRTPNTPRIADKQPYRCRIIQGVVDDVSGDEIIELTDSSVELTPLKVKPFNSKRELGEKNPIARRTPVHFGGDESIIVL